MVLIKNPNKDEIYYFTDIKFCRKVAAPALHIKPLYHLKKCFTFSGYMQNYMEFNDKKKTKYKKSISTSLQAKRISNYLQVHKGIYKGIILGTFNYR